MKKFFTLVCIALLATSCNQRNVEGNSRGRKVITAYEQDGAMVNGTVINRAIYFKGVLPINEISELFLEEGIAYRKGKYDNLLIYGKRYLHYLGYPPEVEDFHNLSLDGLGYIDD